MPNTETSSIGNSIAPQEPVTKSKVEEKDLREEALDADDDSDESLTGASARAREEAEAAIELEKLAQMNGFNFDEENDFDFDAVDNILELNETTFPQFTLAKNKARFLRMVSWYRQKEEWIEVAPVSGVTKLFKQQTKELEGIRSSKLDYEMELETGTLTPSQRSYRRDELKMCKVQEKMAVHLISKLQIKIKSGRR
jgi:hypothetical protein